MYAVINNSMGSESVTYECEGHETRLLDCMSSPLSSTIAPCYYALVKCITDKKSGGSTTSGLSAGIVAGVVVSSLTVLLVVTIVVLIVGLTLKRRAKKPGDNNVTIISPLSPTYASFAAVTRGNGASNETLELTNPTYTPTHFQAAQNDETLEYKFDNPLYSTPSTPTEAGFSES